jgi:hypothetical protein
MKKGILYTVAVTSKALRSDPAARQIRSLGIDVSAPDSADRVDIDRRAVPPRVMDLIDQVLQKSGLAQKDSAAPALGQYPAEFAKLSNLDRDPSKVRWTSPVGPFRCLAMITSAIPFRGVSWS